MLPLAFQRAIDHAGAKEQVGDERDTGKMGPRQRSILSQIAVIRVARRPGARARGWLAIGSLRIPVALGRSGIAANKREGDGATPRGSFHLVRLWWRADRLPRPRTLLPTRRIERDDAWIEDPGDRRYNRAVERTPDEPGDRLWRADHLYDLMIELDHNTRPRVAGRGSAVFIHVARPGFGPTAGCVALERKRLSWLLSQVGPKTRIMIR
jgi:L,D-peptidoglycan transpeptidase YkuD (ErfK/YbiS/YcfS/YnhG family)